MMENIKFTPLGGFGEVGKNLLILEINNKAYIIDAGIKFSIDPEIDFILPDIDYLEKIKPKIQSIFITHGHEDHVGAISKLAFLKVPIFCPPMAKEIIKKKLFRDQHKFLKSIEINKIYHFDDLKVTWFPVVHSIPDSCGLIIQTKSLNVVHTGDFRFDSNPVFGKNTNFNNIKKRINNKCDILLSDSTNSLESEKTFSEKEIETNFNDIFKENRRIIICTFASQISRLQMAINIAKKTQKNIRLLGSTLKKNLKISKNLNIIYNYEDVISTSNKSKDSKESNLIYFVTGSQGEEFSVLNRISNKKYHDLEINNNDLILMSSSVIPGNENKIFEVIHRLQGLGAEVRFSNNEYKLHVSGHSNKNELSKVISILNPKYFIPLHGNKKMLEAHKKLANSNGVKEKNIFVLSNGDNLIINNNEAKKIKPEKIIDEVVLREFPEKEVNENLNHYNKKIVSIIILFSSKINSQENKVYIKVFDTSNNMKLKGFIENYVRKEDLLSMFNKTEGWDEITKQFNKKLYKLILDKFNKEHLIKSIFIEK